MLVGTSRVVGTIVAYVLKFRLLAQVLPTGTNSYAKILVTDKIFYLWHQFCSCAHFLRTGTSLSTVKIG